MSTETNNNQKPRKAFVVTRLSEFYDTVQTTLWELGYTTDEQIRSIKEAIEKLIEAPSMVVVDSRFEKVAKPELMRLINACKKFGIAIHIILEALKLRPLVAQMKLEKLAFATAKANEYNHSYGRT